jgi:hypothetical protein
MQLSWDSPPLERFRSAKSDASNKCLFVETQGATLISGNAYSLLLPQKGT